MMTKKTKVPAQTEIPEAVQEQKKTNWSKRLLGVVVVVVIIVMAGVVTYEVAFWEKIFPGIEVAGVKVGGMSREEAGVAVAEKTGQMKEVKLVWGTSEWSMGAEDLRVTYDVDKTVEAAYLVGRGKNWGNNLRTKYLVGGAQIEVDPVFGWDEVRLDEKLALIVEQINIPAREPEISVDKGAAQAVVSAGENGQEVDVKRLKQRVGLAVKNLDQGRIEIPVHLLRPKLSDEQLVAVRTRAQNILGKKLVIELEDGQKWEVLDEQLLTWLDPQNEDWKEREVEKWIAELAKTVDRPAQNASFRFVEGGKVEEFKPGRNGYQVKQGEMVVKIVTGLEELEKTGSEAKVQLVVEKVAPEVNTGDANNLGIKELIGKGESWFSGSITNRIFNLRKAAEALNGVLVPPGETFSFNDTVGEISAATGYRQAYVIKDGKTILGDGGGVCQVSSTLFRAVLATGLPISERVAHAYRVSYYEENYQPGFDATIFQPAPDFKFKNDTPAHILIQTEFNEKDKHLVFYFYGTGDGRKVELSKARVWDVTAPPPDLYVDDPNLSAGVVRQVEHKAYGAKVAFDWKVTRDGEVLQERTFFSNYRPWQAVYSRGTKIN